MPDAGEVLGRLAGALVQPFIQVPEVTDLSPLEMLMRWLALSTLLAGQLSWQPTAPIRVSGGLLRGSVSPDGTHVKYLTIPYATVDRDKRFQAAQPDPKWEGVYDAFNENVRCTQRFTGRFVLGQEDCLNLNVYAPLHKSHKLRPVMVFIHGGGFRDGSGSPLLYGPEYLVQHGVILVTFNYRLEVLGFLCLGINEAPGNVGMKDQVEALRWVKKNIKAFGGDPDNVTLFGESAGAASVTYHLVSPMSKGLFNKAIMQSGSAISPWTLQYDPIQTASKFVKQLGHETKDPYKIYDILINKTDKELLSTRVPRAEGDVVLSENIFVPCIEKKFEGIDQFLTDDPFTLMTNGQYHKVPIILGYNSAEGYMFVAKENDTTIAKLDFYKSLPLNLDFPTTEVKRKVAKKLQHLYMGDREISRSTILKFSRYEGEAGIVFPVLDTAEMLLKSNDQPIYTYKFSYSGLLNIPKFYFGFFNAPGATHADELFYLFKTRIPWVPRYFELQMVFKLTKMWTNFAKYSDPTPKNNPTSPVEWKPTDPEDPRLLVIDKQFSTAPLWEYETVRSWRQIYSKYRRKL